MVDPPEYNGVLVLKIYRKLLEIFEITTEQMVKKQREMGKACRGISIPKYNYRVVEFNILNNVKVSYETLRKMSFDDIIFLNIAIKEKIKQSKR